MAETAAEAKQRFETELEFVQCLANVRYLHRKLRLELEHQVTKLGADLAQNRYLEDQAFVNYLSYLQYWATPEYARYPPARSPVPTLTVKWGQIRGVPTVLAIPRAPAVSRLQERAEQARGRRCGAPFALGRSCYASGRRNDCLPAASVHEEVFSI